MSHTKALSETLRHGEELNAVKVAERIGCTLPQARQALNCLWNRNELERLRIGVYRKNPEFIRNKTKTAPRRRELDERLHLQRQAEAIVRNARTIPNSVFAMGGGNA